MPHRRGLRRGRAISHHLSASLRRDGRFCFHAAERCPATGAIGASIPPRLCPASGPATIGAPACPATGHLVSITPSVAPRPSHLGLKQSGVRIVTTRDDRAATGRATIPLDLNAASVHPIVTIPWALAIAPRATPPRLAPRPSHLAPSVGQPAPRRTILFPCRRALPGDRCHRGFHPAEALPRERTGHHRRPGLPRDGTSCFHHADRRPATEPSWLEAERSADRNDQGDRAATGRATMPLDPNAASVHPIVTIPLALAIARRATPPRLAPRPSHLATICRPACAATDDFVSMPPSAAPRPAPSGLPSRRGFAPRADRPPSATRLAPRRDILFPSRRLAAPRRSHLGLKQSGVRIVTTRVTERRREEQPLPLDPNAASSPPYCYDSV